MAGSRGGASAGTGRLIGVCARVCARVCAGGLLLVGSWAVGGCAEPGASLGAGVPLGAGDEVAPGRFAVDEDTIYEIELECRVTLPFNSESLELGDAGTGSIELEPAPSPFYSLGVETAVRFSSIRSEDHTTWLELATLEPVPSLGDYETARDASREQAFAALRRVRGDQVTEMDLVQARVREFYLAATVAFRIPPDIRTEALDMERQVGGALVAFFISPELPGEGVSLTLTAPGREGYVMKATVGGSCPRLVLRRDDVFTVAPPSDSP